MLHAAFDRGITEAMVGTLSVDVFVGPQRIALDDLLADQRRSDRSLWMGIFRSHRVGHVGLHKRARGLSFYPNFGEEAWPPAFNNTLYGALGGFFRHAHHYDGEPRSPYNGPL